VTHGFGVGNHRSVSGSENGFANVMLLIVYLIFVRGLAGHGPRSGWIWRSDACPTWRFVAVGGSRAKRSCAADRRTSRSGWRVSAPSRRFRRAALVWEPRRVVPSYAVPAGDIRGELAPSAAAPPSRHVGEASASDAHGLASQEGQQVGVELILMGVHEAVRRARLWVDGVPGPRDGML
jgi:hypothetical protein